MINNRLKIITSLVVPAVIIATPREWFQIDHLTVIEHRVIALFFLAAMLWITEAIPIYATSILIIVLELITISSSGINVLIVQSGTAEFGEVIPYKAIMSTFSSPIILLFLGGFFLAMASTKYRLDQNLARVLLKPFGNRPAYIIMGLMIITALFSMFMSNTATTAMMLSIIAPVLFCFDQNDRGKIALALCIPLAANIGGLGTPIGTPPNALALKYLTGVDYIGFGQWMSFGVPFVIVLLSISWVLLLKIFPSSTKEIKLDIQGEFSKTPKALVVYATFCLTILLWLFDFVHGMNSYTVALIPVGVFLSFNIITKEDLKKINWDVLWLVSGGIALGLALGESGLAEHVVASIPFDVFSPLVIIGLTAFLAALMANFMSNTATANLLLPIIATIGTTVLSLEPLGGSKMLILGTTLAASLGMALPISTPPNALAHATGIIETKDMLRVGVLVGGVGLVLVFALLYILKTVNFL
ncbi:MAG: SLC13 family permease [Reichenbachiella sp.]|uniref:SLC13 family permease n=1 Tax=Reichenbachiella sp. TaxID=2184521 RepID=UPI002965FD26|nr:SLC13 family permease [Reichenbachiella sp.]MDW3210138.1 SLC13 family permease [Reichenbachiella sp.]